MKKHLIIGLVITFIWLVIMVFILYYKTSFNNISVNELGDFLGGFFSPIAFLWLILGYIQQGYELQQNTIALTQQKEEYTKSVKLSAYISLLQFESNEASYLNNLGAEKYFEGIRSARDRSKYYKNKIKELLQEIDNIN